MKYIEDEAFASVNVTIRTHETELITSGQLDRMLAADSFEEALMVLRESPYRYYLDEVLETGDYNQMFTEELAKTYDWLQRESPSVELVELLTLRYTYHNLKVLFKEHYMDEDYSYMYIPIGRYSIESLRRAVKRDASSVLSQDYLYSINEMNAYMRSFETLLAVDIILDREFLNHYGRLAKRIGNEKIQALTMKRIDYENISIAIRAIHHGRTVNFLEALLSDEGDLDKNFLVRMGNGTVEQATRDLQDTQYGDLIEEAIDPKTNEISTVKFDRLAANAYMKDMHSAKLNAFGPLPLIGFVYAKETEITNLRLALSAKQNNVDPEIVKERMRLDYEL